MFGRRRIRELERELAASAERLDAIELAQRDRAALVSIVQDGRSLIFTFVRNGKLTRCETYSTMEADVPGWKRALIERQP
jgi:hypothetical protein